MLAKTLHFRVDNLCAYLCQNGVRVGEQDATHITKIQKISIRANFSDVFFRKNVNIFALFLNLLIINMIVYFVAMGYLRNEQIISTLRRSAVAMESEFSHSNTHSNRLISRLPMRYGIFVAMGYEMQTWNFWEMKINPPSQLSQKFQPQNFSYHSNKVRVYRVSRDLTPAGKVCRAYIGFVYRKMHRHKDFLYSLIYWKLQGFPIATLIISKLTFFLG